MLIKFFTHTHTHTYMENSYKTWWYKDLVFVKRSRQIWFNMSWPL